MAARKTASKRGTRKSAARKRSGEQWMAEAFGKNPGALHRALGVPEGENIPAGKMAKAAKKGGKMGKRAVLGQTGARIARANAKKKR